MTAPGLVLAEFIAAEIPHHVGDRVAVTPEEYERLHSRGKVRMVEPPAVPPPPPEPGSNPQPAPKVAESRAGRRPARRGGAGNPDKDDGGKPRK